MNVVISFGRPSLIFSTFLYVLLVDQAKSFITLALVYMIVVRRFMYLAVNEHEYSDPATRPPPQENAIPHLKSFCLKILESTIIEGISMFIICLYTVFVLFQLTNS